MDGSGLFSLSACEQIEKFEWVEVPVEKKPEPEKADEPKAEDKKEQGEPMETDGAAKDDKMETEEKKDEGDAKAPEMRKEKKIKQRKSPLKMACIAQLSATPSDVLNKFLEIECQLKSKDKEEKDKSDAKNELEEAVYA